jgi:predicted ATPase
VKRNRAINLPAPYLRRLWLEPSRVADPAAYPFCLPFLSSGFELNFDRAITIIVGENGTGKSTLLEGIAALAGYDEAGGGKGYMPVDHSRAVEAMGGRLSTALRASWLPRITNGWFFRAESFFSVARYLDEAATEWGSGPPPDFLSHSHGEGFSRFFEERCEKQGIFFFDEPESALSRARQIEFLKLLRRMDRSGICQVVMATHTDAAGDARNIWSGAWACSAAADVQPHDTAPKLKLAFRAAAMSRISSPIQMV